MASAIVSNVGDSMAAATGNPGQGHLVWAPHQGAWWLLYLSSTNAVSALYSADGSSWSAPSPASYTLLHNHVSEGRNYGFGCKEISGIDVLGMGSSYASENVAGYGRFRLDSTGSPSLNNTDGETAFGAPDSLGCSNAGVSVGFNPANRPYIGFARSNGNQYYYYSATADGGSSWGGTAVTTGTGYGSEAWEVWSSAILPFGTGEVVIGICDNGHASASHITNLVYEDLYNQPGTNLVFASDYTQTTAENWGCVARTTSDIHVVALTDNSVQLTHKRFNGTDWTTVAGDAILGIDTIATGRTIGTNSGVAVVSHGENVWVFIVDNTLAIQYTQWTLGSGWSAWASAVTARTYTPKYLIASINGDGSKIQLAWTETDASSHYNIIGSTFTITTPTPSSATLSLTGPASSRVGVPSGNFTITLDATADTDYAFDVTYSGGTITSTPVTVTTGNTTATFTVTPTSIGAANVSVGASDPGSITPSGSPISYTGTALGSVLLMEF